MFTTGLSEGEDVDEEMLARWRAEQQASRLDKRRRQVTKLDGPIYAPEGLPVWMCGRGQEGGIALRHRAGDVELCVESREGKVRPHDAQAQATDRLGTQLHDRSWPRRSEDGMRVWMGARERERERVLAKGRYELLSVRVDGVMTEFAVAAAGRRFVAVAQIGKHVVTCSGAGVSVEALHLRGLADPTTLGVCEDEATAGPYDSLREARAALDPALVAELATDSPLADIAGELAALARPGFRPVPGQPPAEPGQSKFGGRPDLPTDAEWPTDPKVGPLTFFAQLALADLDPAVWPGPREGLLSIFCAINFDYWGIDGPGGAHVVHWPTTTSVQPHDFPAQLEEGLRLEEHPIADFLAELTLPSAGSELDALGFGYDGHRGDDGDEHLSDLIDRLHDAQGAQPQVGQVLGWGAVIQDWDEVDALASTDQPWVLLAQLDLQSPLITVGLPLADLEAGRFDRAEAGAGHD